MNVIGSEQDSYVNWYSHDFRMFQVNLSTYYRYTAFETIVTTNMFHQPILTVRDDANDAINSIVWTAIQSIRLSLPLKLTPWQLNEHLSNRSSYPPISQKRVVKASGSQPPSQNAHTAFIHQTF